MRVGFRFGIGLCLLLAFAICSAAFEFSDERVYGNGLTELYWEFTPFSEDTASYKEQWLPRIDNINCQDAKIEMYELLPVTYYENVCEPTYKETCEDTLIKGDAKNGTEDHYESVCHQEVIGESCESTPRTVYEKYDVTKTDMLFVKDAKLVIHATRKARTGFQACDLNFEYDNGITTVDSADFGKTWWNSSFSYKQQLFVEPVTSLTSNTSWQVKIIINSTNFNYSLANSSGYDLRCVNEAETTTLSLWLDYWNTSGTSVVWCGNISFSNTTNASLWLYYGNPSASSISNATTTFGNSLQFYQPFSNNASDRIVPLDPSLTAGNVNQYTDNSVNEPRTPGYLRISGADGADEAFADSASIFDFYSSDKTVVWWSTINNTGDYEWMFNKGTDGAHSYYDIVCWNNGSFYFYGNDGAGGTGSLWFPQRCDITAPQFFSMQYVSGSRNTALWRNMSQFSSATAGWTGYSDAYTWYVGTQFDTGYHHHGTMDEIRIYNEVLSNNSLQILYAAPHVYFGNLELKPGAETNLNIGVLNSSWLNTSVIGEGKDFKPWANYSYATNGSSVTNVSGTCVFNLTNVSVEYYSTTGTNATVCTGGACTYTNKTGVWTADTSLFNTDVYRFRLCRSSSATPDAYYSVSCVGGAGTNGNIPSSVVPLCSAGWLNYTVTSAGCVGAGSQVNVSVWTTGNTLAKSYRLIDDSAAAGYGYPGFDRYRDEVNTQMVWNDTMQLWHSALWYEYYEHGNKNLSVWCYDADSIENQSTSVIFGVENRAPLIIWDYIEDWLTGIVSPFSSGLDMRYPLSGSVNTSVLASDNDLDSFGINLTFENGTYIYGHTGSGSPGKHSWGASNFSTANNYLDSLLGYYVVVTVNDTYGDVVSGSRLFYAGNDEPVSSWSNASGGTYSTQPVFEYVCSDREGEDMTGYVVWEGATMATNSPVVNATGVQYNTAGFGVGTWTIGIICEDSFRNSSNTTISWTYATQCIPSHSGLDDVRYQNNEVEVCLGCSNSINLTGAWYRINDFDLHEITSNLSECWNMTLELGWNRLNLTVEGNGLNVSSEYNVWAKKMDSSIFDYPVIWFMIAVALFLFLGGVLLSVPFLSAIGSLFVGFVGYELLSISMFSGGMTIIAGILMALYFAFKQK